MLFRALFVSFGPQNRCLRPRATRREKCPDWLAEGVGFEPTRPFWGLTVFKTAGFNRSPTPPVGLILAPCLELIARCSSGGLDRKTGCIFPIRMVAGRLFCAGYTGF